MMRFRGRSLPAAARRAALALAALLGPALTGGCSDGSGPGPVACTEEFRSWHLAVRTGAGTPVESLAVTVTRTGTGEELPYGGASIEPGSYLVMDDGMTDRLAIAGEEIRVEGEKPGVAFEAQYRFAADAARCHVIRLAGPDTVVVAD